MLKHVNNRNFEKELNSTSKVVIVDFFATWCGPCQMLSPVLEKVSNSRLDCEILKVDVDESLELASRYKINVVPTLIIFKNGKPLKQVEGFLDENELASLVEEYV